MTLIYIDNYINVNVSVALMISLVQFDSVENQPKIKAHRKVRDEAIKPGYTSPNGLQARGSKGQYIRRARDKFRWDGIPEFAIPSYFTSTTCPAHAKVDATMRRGDQFLCPRCSKPEHADEHAADTIGNYLLLRPLAVT